MQTDPLTDAPEAASAQLQAHGRPSTLVSDWFGAQFSQLHPLLQQLHQNGGVLRGEIRIDFGPGIAGWVGRRLARSLGIPVDRARCGFEVDISHTADALHWNRRFENGATMRSTFTPSGHWPHGHWSESTGTFRLDLGVDTTNGAWHWIPKRAYWHGLCVPITLLPQTRAGKWIEDERYVFRVELVAPLLGLLLRYHGALDAQ